MPEIPPPTEPRPSPLRMLARWLREGGRTALLLRRPRWGTLEAHPLLIAALIVAGILASLVCQRLWIVGPARFNWQPLLTGWLATAAAAWACHALLHRMEGGSEAHAPSAAHLFSLLLAQGVLFSLLFQLFWTTLIRSGDGTPPLSPETGWWIWAATWLWIGLAQALTLWRASGRKPAALLLASLLLGLGVLESSHETDYFWIPEATASSGEGPRPLRLTQEVMEAQPRLLDAQLQELAAQRPGVVDLYALTFAPYAHEDVFRRESALVAEVMSTRLDTAGRTLQLVNHPATAGERPWATPLNLQRAIRHIAGRMDPAEDILFIHLTSHGAQEGELAASFWPLAIDSVTPRQLRQWLDEAGIRHRVISVSACYSGSWIEPLRGDDTLVMTASDAEHTSYGCGRHSELTYFGRAVFDEQLRRETRSFEEAHAAARPLIDQREQAAGKTDGYSNPQIAAGEGARRQIGRLLARLAGQ